MNLVATVVRAVEPSPDGARSSMRRELLKPEYYSDNWLQRLLAWLDRQLSRGMDVASNLSAASTVAALVILVILVGSLAWLASRARPAARVSRAEGRRTVAATVTASQLRARAEAALAEGRAEDAVADAFRAVAARQIERGSINDSPGTTAQEAARRLSATFPAFTDRVDAAAALFDAVLYGDQPATRDNVVDVLDLDAELSSVR